MKKRDFKVLGGSLFLAGTTYQGTFIFDSAVFNFKEFFANFLPMLILVSMVVMAIFFIAQTFKKKNNNNANS